MPFEVRDPVRTTRSRRGALAGGGTAVVRLYVYRAPIPDQVPERWRERAVEVRDGDGTLVDWRYNAPVGDTGAVELDADDWREFRRWRARFVDDRLLGDVASIRTFIDWADHHCDATALHVLRLPTCSIDVRNTAQLAFQAERAAVACRASGETGVGILVEGSRGALRGFVTSRGPVEVIAEGDTSLVADERGLVLRTGAEEYLVRGWRREGDGVTVATDREDRELGAGSLAAELLGLVASGRPAVSVQRVPLSSIFAELLVEVQEMAREANAAAVPLVARCGGTI